MPRKTTKRVAVSKKSSRQIVKELEKPHTKEFTEAAHAEMMRRFTVEIEKFNQTSGKNTRIIIALTIFIVLLTAFNLFYQFTNISI